MTKPDSGPATSAALVSTATPDLIDRAFALVVAGDQNEDYARGLAVSLHSTLTKLSRSVRPYVCVLDNGLSERSRARLTEIAEAVGRRHALQLLRVPTERLEHLGGGNYPVASYSRLLMPELLPRGVRRAVWLDADVLVKDDLSQLFSLDIGPAPFAAVKDFVITSTAHKWSGVREPGRGRPYFNAGVLVVDVPRWRAAGLTELALEYASAGSEPLRFADQDALNAVAEDWHELNTRWNVQHPNLYWSKRRLLTDDEHRRRRELYRSAAVLHFVDIKPWCRRCANPGVIPWVRTLVRTGWCPRREALARQLRWVGNRVAAHKHALFRSRSQPG